ncbi:MAG: hypothetical protein D8M57_07865 [Candidatus Scalindua sp. AMX11]|nr:MAG: hypothetical protein DWQ00_11465 [Candidatus Scalindua sp.]NOG85289.1 hypothetical protein [Planctomycetota bacterium]RZV81492.1 MAG: hypothetical protein EX341_10265 [Candidatus Scalindua sp. SCAELEC01]TDE65435.1 MAG: hypothetical protein D8M57_07865 [Candidatus Scalindua sp. AMX11]GJQ59357.1 MAG: hypothetical protein SCALA701_21580 [Candidatus Scalindua sp.]
MEELFQKLYHENSEVVEEALGEIGRVGKGNQDAMKALQEFLRRERRMTLRILATQTIAKVKKISHASTGGFSKPSIFQCPGAEKIKRVEIIDVRCPFCEQMGTASVAGFENEYACESCGEKVERELPESCIEKCPVGSECVGKERYQKYMKGRSDTTL